MLAYRLAKIPFFAQAQILVQFFLIGALIHMKCSGHLTANSLNKDPTLDGYGEGFYCNRSQGLTPVV